MGSSQRLHGQDGTKSRRARARGRGEGQSELVAMVKAKRLCEYVLSATDKSPKKFRFTLVSRLQNYGLDVVENMYKANMVRVRGSADAERIGERRSMQREAYVGLGTLAFLALIAREQGCLLPRQYEQISTQVHETTRLLVAWAKADQRRYEERLRLRRYSRYMDDGVVVHEDKSYLKESLGQMRDYLASERGLELNQKTQIVPLAQGVDYLGFHLYLTDTGKVVRRLRSSNKRRIKARLKRFRHAYGAGRIDAAGVNESLRSYMAHLGHGDTWRLRQNMLRHLVLTRDGLGDRSRHEGCVGDDEGLTWDL